MAREINAALRNKLTRLYESGMSIDKAGKTLGIGRKKAWNLLRSAGVDTAKLKLAIDVGEIVEWYTSGESEKGIADKIGVSRQAIRKRLLDAGIKPRNQSEAGFVYNSRLTSEQRKANAMAANQALRELGQSDRMRFCLAKSREKSLKQCGVGEFEFMSMLKNHGIKCVHQKAVGPYNIDIACPSVAVEISICTNKFPRAGDAKKIKDLLDLGWNVIYITMRSVSDITTNAVDYVVGFVKETEADPAFRGQYRVIRGSGDRVV